MDNSIIDAPNLRLVKSVTFYFDGELPCDAKYLLQDFRLAVNCAIRAGLQLGISSRNAFNKMVYKDFRKEHPRLSSYHLVAAFEIAAAILKVYRKRLREGKPCHMPYQRTLMARSENMAYKLDPKSGIIDLAVRAGCHVKIPLTLSEYHRKFLNDDTYSLGSLTILSDRVSIAFRKPTPKCYTPESILSLDTNERSLDGVLVNPQSSSIARADFPEIAIIQQRHHDRRRALMKKKSHDGRMAKTLCKKEGIREHHRVEYRLHQIANSVLFFAEGHRSAIILEDLKGIKPVKGTKLSRRIGIWPRRELHRIIEYKARWKGIPVVKVNPRNSSRKCPICGSIQNTRMGAEFECECGWHLDRHINASINLLQSASSKGLAGGLWFDPGAFQRDVVMVLYDPVTGARSEPNGMSNQSRTGDHVLERMEEGN